MALAIRASASLWRRRSPHVGLVELGSVALRWGGNFRAISGVRGPNRTMNSPVPGRDMSDDTSICGFVFDDLYAVGTTNPVIKPAESLFHMFISPTFLTAIARDRQCCKGRLAMRFCLKGSL